MVIPNLKFKKGDIVRLQSGGPKMVVQWTKGDIVGCVWGRKMEKESEIFVHVLEKVIERSWDKMY